VTLLELRQFLRTQPWAVEATVSSGAGTQSAVVGIAITDDLELVFDTLNSARKHFNLERDPRISFVVGWDAGCTAQVEGLADQPVGAESDRLKECYFARFPEGKERAKLRTIAYWRVRPTWIRFADYNTEPPTLIEWTSQMLSSFDGR
jgi:Pyridoxamine 5'-phosphate oxidase